VPYRIEIDTLTCVGFADCTRTAPGAFRLDEQTNQSAVVDPAGAEDEVLLQAARGCPVCAITIYDETGRLVGP
jgi:ferredoxin